MRIGIDASGVSGWRGPSRNIRNIINHLAKMGTGHEFYLFSPYECLKYLDVGGNVKSVLLPYRKMVPWHGFSLPISAKKHKIGRAHV